MWTGEYASGGAYEFWSLGQPKRDFVQLVSALPVPEEGMTAAILGCGLGLEVDFLARAARNRTSEEALHTIAGVDFASTAIDSAREAFGQTPGAFFYHADVCELPPPTGPLDLLVDNTVFQNVHGTDHEQPYLEALRRASTPGHTVLHLNLMSQEGVARRPALAACMEGLSLPLQRRGEILEAFSRDWELLCAHEGLYDLRPEGAGFECGAFYEYGGHSTPGIPSWWMLLLRK